LRRRSAGRCQGKEAGDAECALSERQITGRKKGVRAENSLSLEKALISCRNALNRGPVSRGRYWIKDGARGGLLSGGSLKGMTTRKKPRPSTRMEEEDGGGCPHDDRRCSWGDFRYKKKGRSRRIRKLKRVVQEALDYAGLKQLQGNHRGERLSLKRVHSGKKVMTTHSLPMKEISLQLGCKKTRSMRNAGKGLTLRTWTKVAGPYANSQGGPAKARKPSTILLGKSSPPRRKKVLN